MRYGERHFFGREVGAIHRIRIMSRDFLLVILLLGIRSNAEMLMLCPDCGTTVSRRALMCPKCGCRGEVISSVSKSILASSQGSVIDVDCDGVRSFALPMKMDGRSFAVLPLESVLGVSRIELRDGNRRIGWTVPELAVDAPIVRLQIQDTNLTYWVSGGEQVFDGHEKVGTKNEIKYIISRGISSTAFPCEGHKWQVLQPRWMRVHGKQVLKMLHGEPFELPQRTHQYFKLLEYNQKENSK